MILAQHHRGPDAQGMWMDPAAGVALGHNRLSILDLSDAGCQPMCDVRRRLHVVFNGEIYNYLELRSELTGTQWHTSTDTEVLLAAYQRWGVDCLEHFIGMFAFVLWDDDQRVLFGARDRFGVKPLYYRCTAHGGLHVASEIHTLREAGEDIAMDPRAWATYLTTGLHDHSERTFWTHICSLPAGHYFLWQHGQLTVHRWYDFAARTGSGCDERAEESVAETYRELLLDSVRLRFRSDVPVGVNLSGGLDSSALVGLVRAVQGLDNEVKAFTYTCGDPRYDELPWVRRMLERTRHPSFVYCLQPVEIPALAASVQATEDGPFGGLPTLAYARLFELARSEGVVVLLDGQGMDEQWAGYEYYLFPENGRTHGPVQAARSRAVRPECLLPDFSAFTEPFDPPRPFPDALRNRQFADAFYTKIPRALRFNDRVSMRASCELREPFLDHRLFELAFAQPPERKIAPHGQKWMLRQITRGLLPCEVVEAPKRPVQTPQREWLANELREWSGACIETALRRFGGEWLDADRVRDAWGQYCARGGDNSFFVWQWISLGLIIQQEEADYPS